MDRISEEYVQMLEAKVAALTALVDELTKQNKELLSRLNKDSNNSSRPPSTDSPFRKPRLPKVKKEKSKNPKGGQKGHPMHHRKILPPTSTSYALPVCRCGSQNFNSLEQAGLHQEVEFPEVQLLVEHIRLMRGTCNRCGIVSTAVPPACQQTGYGPRMTALVGELSGPLRLSRTSVQRFMQSVLGFHLSCGGIQKMIDRASSALEPAWSAFGLAARGRQINHIDETPWRSSGNLHWVWAMEGSGPSFFIIHRHRSKEAFQELIMDWKGILISDDYGTYRNWKHGRQTCLAHLMRAARGHADHSDPFRAKAGNSLLGILATLHGWKDRPPDSEAMEAWTQELHAWCQSCRERNGPLRPLARRIAEGFPSLITFLCVDGVEPTNNCAERAVRFGVLWRKVAMGTDSLKGCRWVERVLSLVGTCRKLKTPTFPLMVQALEAYFQGVEPDLAWIPTV